MKFNKVAVIGNPPYQVQSEAQQAREGNGKQQAKPIYHLFVEAAIDNLNPDYVSMIIPSRWMVGGMGLNAHRERMMNDTKMKKIVHFGGEKEVFGTVSIKGGVNYFMWDKKHDGECEFVNGNTSAKRALNQYDIILQDNNAISILEKILHCNSNFANHTCLGRKPFGLSSNHSEFTESGIKCIIIRKSEKFVGFNTFTDKNNILGKWKVATSGGIDPSKVDGSFQKFNSLFIIEPEAICTETYIIVNTFNTKIEAENYIGYMKTKFYRFMLGLRVATQNINKGKFAWVPDLQDYSMPWTDAELYKKFGLTHQEIAYIESKIKTI